MKLDTFEIKRKTLEIEFDILKVDQALYKKVEIINRFKNFAMTVWKLINSCAQKSDWTASKTEAEAKNAYFFRIPLNGFK